MSNINRRVASQILLAALDYKAGDRSGASARLLKASQDPDFDETVDGLAEQTDKETDPFLTPEQAEEKEGDESNKDEGDDGDDAALNLEGLDDLLNEDKGEQASLARTAKKRQATAADDDKIGGNDGPTGADSDNDSDEEIRQEAQVARLQQTRKNLLALAAVR